MTTLTAIAEQLLEDAKRIDNYVTLHSLPPLSFRHETFTEVPLDIQDCRDRLINGSAQLRGLAEGPAVSTIRLIFNWTELLVIREIYHYKIAHAIPVEGTATYAEIAASTGQAQSLIARIVRFAMSINIFDEASPGQVCHTAISRLIATNRDIEDFIGVQTEEFAPTGARHVEAITRFGDSQEPNETAFNLVNNSSKMIYEILGEDPERARRLGGGMHFFISNDTWDFRHLFPEFDWTSVDRLGAVAVDIGGGEGHISQFIANRTQHLKFIVQDLPHVVEHAKRILPSEYDCRVEFMAQDFLQPQTMPPPDVFIIRWVLHNWSDKYCIIILRNLIPALKQGAKILLYEFVLLSEPVKDATLVAPLRLDMVLATCFNAKERTAKEFQDLIAEADSRFVWKALKTPQASGLSLIELAWDA